MLIKSPDDILPSEITPESIYQQRRRFIKGIALTAASITAPTLMSACDSQSTPPSSSTTPSQNDAKSEITFDDLKSSEFDTDEELTKWEYAVNYNNFVELGEGKTDPIRNADKLVTRPWSVAVEGEVSKPGVLDIEDILKQFDLEERTYRLRCIEAWSMVIPWIGFPLSSLLKRFEPTSKAKFVEFISVHDPKRLPGQRSDYPLIWPYVEGLRIDEAMHPLTILSVGMYGKVLPNQNGSPIRLVVPWKYGFKSSKSIVKIRLVEEQPLPSWVKAQPDEYGFYSNVNPLVPHPRWDQRTERRIGEFFKRDTMLFNGYAEQVAGLYTGMDLGKYF